MKRFLVLSLIAVGGVLTSFSADWVFEDGYISDGVWKLPASLSGTNLTIGRVDGTYGPEKVIPANGTALDLSKRVTNAAGDTDYTIKSISTRGLTNVGLLTLPGEGLTEIGYQAFNSCSSLSGQLTLPSTLTTLGQDAFYGKSGVSFTGSEFHNIQTIGNRAFRSTTISGTLDLSSVTSIAPAAFCGCVVSSVRFGGNEILLQGNTSHGGAFSGCSSLTSVEFDEGAKVTFDGVDIFKNCTALETIDLRTLKSVTFPSSDKAPLNGCSHLVSVSLSGMLQSLPTNFFYGVGNTFSTVDFYGAPPAEIGSPVLMDITPSRGVVCYVHLNPSDPDYAAQKAAWDALTADGELTSGSTWSQAMAGDDYLQRPLRLFQSAQVSVVAGDNADEGTATSGSFVISRDDNSPIDSPLAVDYTITGTAVAGRTYTALSGTAVIPADELSVTVEVAPLWDNQTKVDSTVILTLDPSESYDIVSGLAAITIVDGGTQTISVTASGDADEGKGTIGYFTISRGENEITTYDLTVSYTVGGTAVAGEAYVPLSGSVTIPAGKKSVKVFATPRDAPGITEDGTIAITLQSGSAYDLGDEMSKTISVKNGAQYGGWKFVLTNDNEYWTKFGYITNAVSGWAFYAKHGRNELTMSVEYAVAWPDEISTIDLSTSVYEESSGKAYQITSFAPAFSSHTEAQAMVGGFIPAEAQTSQGGFLDCTNLTGTIVFNNETMSVGTDSFKGCTKLEGLVFNCKRLTIGGNYGRGAFQDCTSLKSVTISPDCDTFVETGFCFNGCTSLRVLDLSTLMTMIIGDNTNYAPFAGSGLRHVVFGNKVTTVSRDAFTSSNIKEIFFVGTDPDALLTSVFYQQSNGIISYVILDPADPNYATLLAKWNACAEGGEINGSSTWSQEKVGSNYTKFPLRFFSPRSISVAKIKDADEAKAYSGAFEVSRGEGDSNEFALNFEYSVGGTAVPGRTYAALTDIATIPAGKDSVTIYVNPLDDPEMAQDSTVSITLEPMNMSVIGSPTAELTIKNGSGWNAWAFSWTSSKSGVYTGTISNSDGWAFNASARLASGTVEVGEVSAWPDTVSPLDFKAGIVSTNGVPLAITTLSPKFNSHSDAAVKVGPLTLPADTTTSFANSSFNGCVNATGPVEFPSTLTSLGEWTFNNCTSLTISCSAPWPKGVTVIPSGVFVGCRFDGQLFPESVTDVNTAAFKDSKLESIRFGRNLTAMHNSYNVGIFYGCTALTNVVFDPESSVAFTYGETFRDCSALTELYLPCVTEMDTTDDVSNREYTSRGHFRGCTNLKKVTFGPKFTLLPATAFKDCAVEEVRFEGAPPETMRFPYLYGCGNRKITTVVDKSMVNVMNTVGTNWTMLAESNLIKTKDTTFAADYISEGIDLSKRPLLRTPYTGLKLILR